MSDSPSIHLGSLSELILYVTDMDAQVRFYRDTLGLSIRFPSGLDDYSSEYWVVLETGACALALHGGGEKEFGKNAPKFVFDTDQIEETRAAFKDAKIPCSEIDSPATGVAVFDAKDPEGNLFSVENRSPATE